jgi:hypothetical protein
MTKKFKNTKLVMIFFILFIGLFVSIFSLTSSAQEEPFEIRLKSELKVDWAIPDVEIPIVPRNEMKILNVTVEYSLTYGLNYSKGMYLSYVNYKDFPFYEHPSKRPSGGYAKGKVRLEILESPSWCHAVFKSSYVSVNISKRYITQTQLYMVLDEDAPAYADGHLLIRASIQDLFPSPIQGFSKLFNLTFTPSYLPIIDVDLIGINTKRIEPHQSAEFPIRISNLGNDQTLVFINVSNLPEGWNAIVTDQVFIKENGVKTVFLSIKPPRDFGFREELGMVRVSVTPTRALDPSQKGEEVALSFLVQSKGFFAEGESLFTIIWIVLLIIIIVLIVRYLLIKKLSR